MPNRILRRLRATALAVPLAMMLACVPNSAQSSEAVTVAQTAEAQTKGGILLVDVRTPGEFARGHAKGAINIPLSTLGAEVPKSIASRDGPIYLICQSGNRSGRAQAQLTSQGVDTLNVSGGTSAWARAGLPME